MRRTSRSRMGGVSGRVVGMAATLAVIAGVAAPAAAVRAQYGKPAASPSNAGGAVSGPIMTRVDAIWANLVETGDAGVAAAESAKLLKELGDVNGPSADFITVARTWRLASLLAESTGTKGAKKADAKAESKGDPKESQARAAFLKNNPNFADALAWVYLPGKDNAKGMFEVIGKLIEAKADVEANANLAAAVVVVLDERNPRSQAWTLGPVEIFNYYAGLQGGRRVLFSPQKLAPELQMHTVDTCIAGEEMTKAGRNFAGRIQVGKTYFDVKYDTQFFKRGQKKAIEGKPYTLENILRFGGVCVEQAYYAEHIAKAIGTPSATITARGDDVGHAWVGYLREQNGKYAWDLTEGRYDDYKGEAASLVDPQTWKPMSDAELQMRADRASSNRTSVMEAIAIGDSAAMATETPQAMKLFERSVNACPWITPVWDKVAERATRQKLDTADVEKWGMGIVSMCGVKYPDFGLKILKPMIATIEKPEGRAAAWKWARERLVESQRNRSLFRYDLAVELRLLEGDGWRDAGNLGSAWNTYRETIKRFGKETPAVQDAGMRCEQMLVKGNKAPKEIVEFWRSAWQETEEPDGMSADFASGSNWSVFGMRYADWLERAGDRNKAESIREKIKPERKH